MAGHKSKDIDKLGEGTRQTKNPRGRCNETQVKLIRKEQPIKPAGKHKSRKWSERRGEAGSKDLPKENSKYQH